MSNMQRDSWVTIVTCHVQPATVSQWGSEAAKIVIIIILIISPLSATSNRTSDQDSAVIPFPGILQLRLAINININKCSVLFESM